MTPNPLHEKLIEESFNVFADAWDRDWDTDYTGKENAKQWLRTAFLQIEQATREECNKAVLSLYRPKKQNVKMQSSQNRRTQIHNHSIKLCSEAIKKLTT